jgi:membrane protease YdiL (CAAX protease family)
VAQRQETQRGPEPVEGARAGAPVLRAEILVVLALSLGAAALRALVDFVGSLTAQRSLSTQHALLVGSLAPGRPTLDLALRLVAIATALAPVALVVYLIHREGVSLTAIGLDRTRPRRDVLRGAGLAAAIGGSGLALYLGAHALGVALTVVPESLPATWWRDPVLVLSAFQNATVEEVILLGYLLRRLDQLGWHPAKAVWACAALRGSYHLYQGLGGFVGNLAMGLIFGFLFRRWRRTVPFLVAHGLIDAVAFVGYAHLAGHVSWLPT